MRHGWAAAVLVASAGQSVSGEAAVRAEIARRGVAPITAELALPDGAEGASAVAAARHRLEQALAARGVTGLRGLGDLPFVALEVDRAGLDTLLATGSVVAVALRGSATVDR